MGSYEKTYVVDGREYELYAATDGESTAYALVDHAGVKVSDEALSEIPADETVRALVRGHRKSEAA